MVVDVTTDVKPANVNKGLDRAARLLNWLRSRFQRDMRTLSSVAAIARHHGQQFDRIST